MGSLYYRRKRRPEGRNSEGVIIFLLWELSHKLRRQRKDIIQMCFAIPFSFEESLNKISENPVSTTAKLFKDMEDDKVFSYVTTCLNQFKKGQYGKTCLEDIRSNMNELEEGEGRVVARYDGGGVLDSDIYIIAYFSFANPGIDSNYTTILYCDEY